jgi:hypothetical protein
MRSFAAGLVIALVAGGAAGCGGTGGTKELPSVGSYVARVLHGEDSAVVISDASKVGPSFKATVEARAGAAAVVHRDFTEEREAACRTLDAVNAAGGVGQTDEEKILEFANQQFNRRAQAEEFAMNLAKLSNFDVSVLPSLYCTAYSMRSPSG